MAQDLTLTGAAQAELARLGRRYLWWGNGTTPHSAARIAAQIMNIGTYEDIQRLEELLPRDALLRVMQTAQPGWFSPRSWDFWRGRLCAEVSPSPPTRTFVDAA